MLGYGFLASCACACRAVLSTQGKGQRKESQCDHLDCLSFHVVFSLNPSDAVLKVWSQTHDRRVPLIDRRFLGREYFSNSSRASA